MREPLADLKKAKSDWSAGEEAKEGAGYLTDVVRSTFTNGSDHLEADARFLKRLKKILKPASPK